MMNPLIGYGTEEYEKNIQDNAERVRGHTLSVYEELWFNSIAENMPKIRAGANLWDFPRQKGRPAIIVGAGPTVNKFKQLDALEESVHSWQKPFIICVDKMVHELQRREIRSNLTVTLDGTPEVKGFYEKIQPPSSVYLAAQEKLNVALTIQTHPSVVSEVERFGKVWWFIPLWDDIKAEKSYTRTFHFMTKKFMIQALGNVGAVSVMIASLLECDPVAFIGLDYGYPPDTPLEETSYFKAYKAMVDQYNRDLTKENRKTRRTYKRQLKKYEENRSLPTPQTPALKETKSIESCYRYLINPDTKMHVMVDQNWDVYRTLFLTFLKHMTPRPRYLNCSPISSLFSPEIVTMSFEDFLKEIEVKKDG